jgi:hypothetical protein
MVQDALWPYRQAMTEYKKPQKAKKGQKETHSSPETAPMLLERVFVVQFRQSTESEPDWFSGRVEHMMSGQFASFESPRELKAFFRRVLNQQLAAWQEKAGSRDVGT